MSGQLVNVAFVIWRESVEALLVIGILSAWLARSGDQAGRGRIYLWSGVGAGLLLSVLLGLLLVWFGESVPEETQQLYQTVAIFIAAALIIQMVFWMRTRGGTLKRDLETSLTDAAERNHWWSVFLLALIAVAREGSETVVFLYGVLAATRMDTVLATTAVAALGFILALATYSLLLLGSRIFSWRVFFKVTEIMLLFLAASLLVSGVDNLVSLGYVPALSGRLWDTSAILPDSGPVGGLVGALTGYRARPDLIQILVLAIYWGLMSWALFSYRGAAKSA